MLPSILAALLAASASAAPRYEVRPYDRSQLPRGVRAAAEKKHAAALKPADQNYKLLQHPLTKTRAYVESLTRSLASASAISAQTQNVLVRVDGGGGLESGMHLGGILIIASRLVRHARSEDELAAVIAHELVHHTHAHAERAYASRFTYFGNERNPGSAAADPFASGGAGGPSAEEKKTMMGFEVEADIIGLRVLVNAGYDPEAAVSVLHAYDELLEKEPRHGSIDAGGRHPPRAARIAGLRESMARDGMKASARRPIPAEVVAELADALDYDLKQVLDYCRQRGETAEKTAWGTVTPCMPAKK